MKGIYLGACKANHPNYNIVYQDINGKRDMDGDMLQVNLEPYDYIICTPPCNYYSKANCNIYSDYSTKTKHILPCSIIKLAESNRPFIIENVINRKRFHAMGIYQLAEYYSLKVFEHGRHTYITNVTFEYKDIPQTQDFKYGGKYIGKDGYHQGGMNVYLVIEAFLKEVTKGGEYDED